MIEEVNKGYLFLAIDSASLQAVSRIVLMTSNWSSMNFWLGWLLITLREDSWPINSMRGCWSRSYVQKNDVNYVRSFLLISSAYEEASIRLGNALYLPKFYESLAFDHERRV